MKVTIETTYSMSCCTTVSLPNGKTWDDVNDWYVKWGVLRVKFEGGEWQELATLDDVEIALADTKRPDRSVVYATIDSDMDDSIPDFDKLLDEQEG